MTQWQRWKNIMKCYPFEEKRLAKWAPPYIVQPKFDGDRCRQVKVPMSDVSFLVTSEENPYFSVPHIQAQLIDSGLSSLPLDGELYSHDLMLEGGHELIHSIASRTVNLHPRHKELEFWVFDLQHFEDPQLKRLVDLKKIALSFPSHIKMAPYWVCHSLDDIKRVYDTLVSQGYEGIIVRHLEAPYEIKRSLYVMKFKPKKTDTYMITDWNEEISMEGVPKGRIGSLTLSSQTGDTFNVSAGLDDSEKSDLWDIRHSLPGLMATVHFQHLTNKQVPKGCFDIEVHLP